MKKRFLTALIIASLAAWARPGGAASVAVLMSADVDAYQAALTGFRDAIGDSGHRIVAEYDMQGDFGRGKKILAEIQSEVRPDMILAVGLWALQVAVNKAADVPVVYAMILNPPSVIDSGAHNVTGASMNVPVEQPITLLRQLGPGIRRVGVMYSLMNTGYLVQQAEAVARAEGLQLIARQIASPKEAIQAINSLQEEGIDALWILPDETVLDPKVLRYALLFSYRSRIPLLGLSERQAQMGALLSLSFASSEDIGRQAGELAKGILDGKPATQVPYTMARRLKLTVNLKAAQKLGMEIPESIVAQATSVIR